MSYLKLKICGLRDNISEVVALEPDYAGFIFYSGSPRFVQRELPTIPNTVKKVGVFVNASLDSILRLVAQHELAVVQLHGDETPKYVAQLYSYFQKNIRNDNPLEIWKAFGIDNSFDFSRLQHYSDTTQKFLFDTKSPQRGGTGKQFNWALLEQYPLATPFLLSGGIALEHVPEIQKIVKKNPALYGIDVNSKFEDAPGLKDTVKLKKMIQALRAITPVNS
jgi:phosphoribosylanthranilate isomerase